MCVCPTSCDQWDVSGTDPWGSSEPDREAFSAAPSSSEFDKTFVSATQGPKPLASEVVLGAAWAEVGFCGHFLRSPIAWTDGGGFPHKHCDIQTSFGLASSSISGKKWPILVRLLTNQGIDKILFFKSIIYREEKVKKWNDYLLLKPLVGIFSFFGILCCIDAKK